MGSPQQKAEAMKFLKAYARRHGTAIIKARRKRAQGGEIFLEAVAEMPERRISTLWIDEFLEDAEHQIGSRRFWILAVIGSIGAIAAIASVLASLRTPPT